MTQITVNEADMKIENGKLIININSDLEKVLRLNNIPLSSANPGQIINNKYIVLEHFEDGTTAVIKKDLLEKTMKFGKSNNWKESDIRYYLNKYYLTEIENEFGKDNIIKHKVNLLSLDGFDDYGISDDMVSLLTIDQYRKYRKVLGENMVNWWLATPDSTQSGWSSSCVRCVGSDGGVNCSGCGCGTNVRPFFILKSSIFVSCQ